LYPISDYVADIGGHGDIIYVQIFSIIAAFILFIACINFMNLSTARSSKRAREVGLRKVVGSSRRNLISQFFGESIILSILAMIIALVLVELSLPYFNEIHGKELSFFNDYGIIILLFGITLITGLLSGIYPALLLSSFKPVTVLKGSISSGSQKGIFRKILVILQFSLSIILIISTIIIHKQLDFIFKSDIGYNREEIISFSNNDIRYENLDAFKDEMRRISNVISVTTSSQNPVSIVSSGYGYQWEGLPEEDRVLIHTNTVDYDFFETFQMDMVEGRGFSRQFSSDSLAFVINEKAAELMGFGKPIGSILHYRYSDESGPVIGVVKNFNFKHVRNNVEPLVIRLNPEVNGMIHVKMNAVDPSKTVEEIQEIWQKFAPDVPFDFSFMDDRFERIYRAERQMGQIFDYFTGFAILISCLGLFGLASFMTEQRFKEIGIRKVLGASIGSVLLLLIKEFTKWVLIANLIAWPIAWYVMDKWLQSFAYKTVFEIWTFVIAGASALAVALITISFRTFKAAIQNPVNALKYE